MNRFPLWKNLMLVLVLAFGAIYAMPNLYAPAPALQIASNIRGAEVNEKLIAQIEAVLKENGISYRSVEITEKQAALVRLFSLEDQLKAQQLVNNRINTSQGSNKAFIVALNMASNTPEWLESIGATPMSLGLDLAGGVHFLLEVDTPLAVKNRLEDLEASIEKGIREHRLFKASVDRKDKIITVSVASEEHQEKISDLLEEFAPKFIRRTSTASDGSWLVTAEMPETLITEIEDHAVSQNLTTLRNRVNELGVSEPLVQKQGRNRIVVELPGVQDTAQAKIILGKTANLEFRLAADPTAPISQREQFDWKPGFDDGAPPQWLERSNVVTGEHVVDARANFDPETNGPKIDIRLNSEGGHRMGDTTKKNIGRGMGVLYIDFIANRKEVVKNGETTYEIETEVDKKLINLATIQGAFSVSFQITGLGSMSEAQNVALLLRAGSLAAPMVFVEERTIGPSLGKENIEKGVLSVQVGLLLVVLFMLIYYRVFGIAANLALAANIILIIALMSSLNATLTLPGIAGIVLTVGMAVDANVLIFSRIKEELKNGLPPQSAINSGFERAFTTILDANLTTLIVAFILFAIGTGPIKGFAVTLSFGILTSMFTAIIGTRAVVNMIYGGRKVSKLWI